MGEGGGGLALVKEGKEGGDSPLMWSVKEWAAFVDVRDGGSEALVEEGREGGDGGRRRRGGGRRWSWQTPHQGVV
ncbi:uncharacterized protein A4U43_C04F15510 [Asparagus officinalis]|uniref:Uncharacterized protein n=1 Tax=Asparagus officinalis TaxID=4686 RepID=A0A5P1F2W9_ASPOF|nr:uncharacterized protein A4U43_C04F15510 [Asparagus officinalis]